MKFFYNSVCLGNFISVVFVLYKLKLFEIVVDWKWFVNICVLGCMCMFMNVIFYNVISYLVVLKGLVFYVVVGVEKFFGIFLIKIRILYFV